MANDALRGGFRYAPRDFSETRKRLGTTVAEFTYEEIVRLTDQYKMRFSEIIDVAAASGILETAAKSAHSKRAVPSVK
jgi:hypothetical protein